MPDYRFQCFECGLQFEATVPMSRRNEKQPCPSCESLAERTVPVKVEGFYSKEVSGPVPQNTGLSGLDAHIDRVIGAHAKQGWEAQEKREADKQQVKASTPEETPKLSKNPDGSYRPMAPDERAAHNRVIAIHNMAMEHQKAKKDPSAQ